MLLRKADWHDPDGIRYLLEHGADPNAMTIWPRSALQHAVRRDNALENIELMLEHGGNPVSRNPKDGVSALALAARRGRRDVIEKCAARGFSPDWQGVEARSAAR